MGKKNATRRAILRARRAKREKLASSKALVQSQSAAEIKVEPAATSEALPGLPSAPSDATAVAAPSLAENRREKVRLASLALMALAIQHSDREGPGTQAPTPP
jgi:hypothetical protein